jgi:hypothetical protein
MVTPEVGDGSRLLGSHGNVLQRHEATG